ncbi:hypothetical protein CW755_05630 [Geobacillus thermodenitrificans]|nr:hypothetical protein CW755_05630 [Geobacillus thermodenitrificans]
MEIADLRMLCMTIKLMNGIRLDQVMKRFGQWVHAIANGRSRRSLFLGVGTIFCYFVPLKEIIFLYFAGNILEVLTFIYSGVKM